MSEKAASSEDLLNDPEYLRVFKEYDSDGVEASGAIPEGHEGPYVPSAKELLEGVRIVTEARLRAARARAKVANEGAGSFIEPEGEMQ